MILFRTRQWGSAEWTQIQVGGPDADDEDATESATASIIGSALATSGLHAQWFDSETASWEDLE